MENNNEQYLAFRKQLGERIQQLRKAKGMSQEELASQIGVDRVHVGYIEQGIRSVSLAKLFTTAQALGIPVRELIPESNT